MDTFSSTTRAVAPAHGTATPNPAGIYIAIIVTIVLVALWRLLLRRVINTRPRRIAVFVGTAAAGGVLLALTMH